MKTRRLSKLMLTALLAGLTAFAYAAGGGGGGGGGEAAYTAQCRGDFGASVAANHFEAFMMATYEFHRAAQDTQRTLLDACVAMGQVLEMPAAQLAGDEAVARHGDHGLDDSWVDGVAEESLAQLAGGAHARRPVTRGPPAGCPRRGALRRPGRRFRSR